LWFAVGIAFPTSISVNNVVSHFSPLSYFSPFFFPFSISRFAIISSDSTASLKLSKHDVVKIHLGAHIDGFAAVHAETLIVGATSSEPATGRQADVIKAAWTAAEAAMRTVKAGNKNWAVTEVVNKAVAPWGCKAVEGQLSCQQSQNVIDGKKRSVGEFKVTDVLLIIFPLGSSSIPLNNSVKDSKLLHLRRTKCTASTFSFHPAMMAKFVPSCIALRPN
jgi:methionine aminopeptidase